GKGFDAARQRAVEEGNFRVIYARPPRVEDVFGGGLLLTWATEDGKHHYEKFDMVVLSQGLEAPEEADKLAQAAGIDLNEYLFAETDTYTPLETSRPGVYVIGAFQGPKDIPDSVTQGGGSAALCAGQLAAARGSETVKATFPEERDISQEEPRIGVFVCHCGINIGGVVNVPEVADYAKTLPNVAYSSANMYSCSQDAQRVLTETIQEHKLNRLVVAACTPRTHEPLFQATLREAGLNRSLFEMANIRDQCSWVHIHEPERATEKAKDAVRMAVAKACHLTALEELQLPVTPAALVVGGGLAGMTAALAIADQGFAVDLVERGQELGGKALLLTADRHGKNPRQAVQAVIERVHSHPKITVHTEAQVTACSGYVGNFTTTVESKGASEIINHGVTVLATGGNPYQPTQYCYGQSPKIVTQLDLEKRLVAEQDNLKTAKQAVMIQCVGSRDEDLTYCSRVCCGQALKNALRLKTLQPEMQIVVLYRDMRSYGFLEDDYRKARRLGVTFTRYSLEHKPEVSVEGEAVRVLYFDPLLGEELEVEADLLALATGIVPEDPMSLAKMLKVPITAEKFFLEAHVKLQPVDLPVDGIYVCGLAHSPRSMDETVAQAQAAAGRACQPLAKGSVTPAPIVSQIDAEQCIGCGACEFFCPYKAIEMYKEGKRRKARTITASCKGCGVCAARCPTIAIDMGRFTMNGIMAQIHAFGEELSEVRHRFSAVNA
ncbi:MAG: 4Fe-4S dicluster domain-containing protein, partial [Candidatus Electrothrix sp. AW5]|nr:4Fe-4S dicluster domain-containing protein [Candidatus Electrothrix gigas]